MEKEQIPKRNALGDKEWNLGPFDHDDFRRSQHTYVFKYYDSQKNHYFPYFDLFSKTKERLENAEKFEGFKEVELYKSPKNPPWDKYIRHTNMQLGMRIEFFKEVFHERSFAQGYQPSHKYFSVIMPVHTYEAIINCITDYGLLPIKDLLFEVISIAQQIYTEDIAFWDRPENKKLITTAEKESVKALKILEKTDTRAFERAETTKLSHLLGISFIFNDEVIKMEHPWLAGEFIGQFKRYYDSMHLKDWRKELARYPQRFDEERDKLLFRFKFARTLYNLLTKTELFIVDKKKPYPNNLMLCIAKLMEFCLIQVAEEGETDIVKGKKIRNWIQRNDIEPALTHAPVEYDNERLLNYFDKDFIGLGDPVKRVDALNGAAFIADRFNIEQLMPDLAHIIQCLQQIGWVIGHQVTGEGFREPENNPEFQNFKKLLSTAKGNGRFASLIFKVDGDDKGYELTQRLPLYLIEEALKKYQQDERVEIDTDLVKTTVTKVDGDTLQISKGEGFALPEERFLVTFTESFYKYLLTEAPPGEHEYAPSEKYYKIIGLILMYSGMFYTNMVDEHYAANKVKQWHKLVLNRKKQ